MGGAERVTISLCNEFCKEYNVHIVSVCGDYRECSYKIDSRIKCFNINICKNQRIRNIIFKSFKPLKEYIRRNSIDIVFMIGHYIPPIVLPIKPFVNSKFVFCDHGALINQIDDKKAVLFRRIASKISDKIIVLTERTMNDYKNIFKTSDQKVDYIYNWVDKKLIDSENEYNANSKKILSCGRFGPEKGYDMLVDIAKKVFTKHPSWEWHIYGDGEKYSEIKNKIYDQGIEKNVVLKGTSNRMYDIYKNYSMFVLTSYREGLPLVLLEAKANGLPTVSFDCATGPSEIIQDKVDGYLVDCYNKDEMARKICELIEDVNLRKDFSHNSNSNLSQFDKENIYEKWNKMIRSL